MEELNKKYKVDLGSGYGHDPKTKEFLERHWNNDKLNHLIRKSWATFKNQKIKNEQQGLGDFS